MVHLSIDSSSVRSLCRWNILGNTFQTVYGIWGNRENIKELDHRYHLLKCVLELA